MIILSLLSYVTDVLIYWSFNKLQLIRFFSIAKTSQAQQKYKKYKKNVYEKYKK